MRMLAMLLTALLAGCASNFAKFYQGQPDARLWPSYIESNAPIAIYTTADPEKDVRSVVSKGYSIIGQSSFNAGSNTVSQAQLLAHAKKIGAQLVLFKTEFTHSVSGAMPLTVPTTSTSYSTGTATAYGTGGSVTAYGSGTTTTYGSQTTMVPYTVHRSDFLAIYFAKTKSKIGLHPTPLDDETRRRLQRNTGVKVDLVIENTGAFEADILAGDIVTKFNEITIKSVDHYYELLSSYEGSEVALTIDRDGNELVKNVRFNKY